MGTKKTNSEAGRPAADRSGTTATDVLSPTALVDAVIASLLVEAVLAESSFEVLTEVMAKFGRFCQEGLAISDVSLIEQVHAEEFIHSLRKDRGEPTVPTMHLRRGGVRLLFREGRRLDLVDGDPTIDIVLPPRSILSTRALTDDEVELCRLSAVVSTTDLRSPIVWALAECTARVSEIAKVCVRDVDVDGDRVFIGGSTRTDQRWAPMTPWARLHLARRLAAGRLGAEPDAPLVPWRSRSPKRPTSAATMAVVEILRRAGIHGEPDVRPGSVVGWAGGRLLREGRSIDQVARALGSRSLDRAAETIGFDWRGESEALEP
jgi:integrase/recombinase XerC